MSEITELIAELCPDGVEWNRLGDVANIKRGTRVVKKNLSASEGYPVFQNSLTPLGYHTDFNEPAGTTFVICAGAAGDIGYSESEYWGADDCYSIECSEELDNKYALHALLRSQQALKAQVRKASIPRLSKDVVSRLEIPIPPLKVQHEIVRILDSFNELEAELEARKAQYVFYRDKLLSVANLEKMDGKSVEMKRLGDIGRMAMCKRVFKSQTSKEGEVPFFKIGTFGGTPDAYISPELYKSYRAKYKFPKVGEILLSASGTIGRTVTYNGEDAYFQDSNIVWLEHDESLVLNTYLKYIYSTLEWKVEGGTIKRLYGSAFHAIEIPVPSLKTQQRIVDILDRFDSLTTSLTNGLPAEIAARRQQYEHYRDRLLDFPRKGANAA